MNSAALTPSAAMVVVADSAEGLQVVLGARGAGAPFAGGHWVFPGGVLSESERALGEQGFQAAARREFCEEIHGLAAALGPAIPLASWDTPAGLPRRFHTRFYLCAASLLPIRPDGLELVQAGWFRGRWPQVLPGPLMFPTAAILSWLGQYGELAEVVSVLGAGPLPAVCPVMRRVGDEILIEIKAPQYPLRRWRLQL